MKKQAKKAKGTREAKAKAVTQAPQVQAAQIVANSLEKIYLHRSTPMVSENTFPDRMRNVDAECGYADPDTMDSSAWQRIYERNEIAARVVELYPEECWQEIPSVYETENPEEDTQFETSWKKLTKSLRGTTDYLSDEGSPIWEALEQLDICSGIGRFGILLLGLDDGLNLEEPAAARENQQLLYLQPYSECDARITEFETEETNPRYGLPVMYEVKMRSLEKNTDSYNTKESTTRRVLVHASRVIHYFDPAGSSQVYGRTRMKQVYHRLYDLHKLHAGSSEMYWKGAFFGLSLETHPSLGILKGFSEDTAMQGKADAATKAMQEQMQLWSSGLQRFLDLDGKSAKSLSPQVVTPEKNADVLIAAICIRLACPKRIFMGTERGELSSGQDTDAWKSRVVKRRNRCLTPRMIVPFIDRLIALRVLDAPGEEGYRATWTGDDAKNELEASQVAKNRTEAMSKFVMGGVDAIMSPITFLQEILGLSAEQIKNLDEQLNEYNLVPAVPEEDIDTELALTEEVEDESQEEA